jgi:ribonuclease J
MEITTVGGYNEVGRNMTAVKVNNDAVILDMGLYLDNYVKFTEAEDYVKISGKALIKAEAVPNINKVDDWKKNVRAIIPTHAHLDHVGGIPYLGNRYGAPIICTPFTAAVIRTILKDEKISLRNEIKILNVNSSFRVSKNIKVEFINMTHSTPQTVMVALHTKQGTILYANDFKLDQSPTLGKKPNIKRLKELGKQGVLVLICDSTYAALHQKTPSESVAKEMLKDVLLGTDSEGKLIIVTTFASHLARIKSIIQLGKRLNRKIIFLGRSLAKYTRAGEEIGIINFRKDVEAIGFGNKMKRLLKKVSKNRGKYLLVVTGHQGEPDATLVRMADKRLDFELEPEDHIIFSCRVIPSPTNIANRAVLEKKLKGFGVRIFKDIHVSGHAYREDLRDLINMVKPEHIIPAHGELHMTSALCDLAAEMGYDSEHVHLMQNGQRIKL